MKQFAQLLNDLYFQYSYDAKKRLILNYLETVPDPDRGFTLAILTDELRLQHAKPNILRNLLLDHYDPHLVSLSYSYVGDLSETIALLWPYQKAQRNLPSITEVIMSLETTSKNQLPSYITEILNRADYVERWAFLKVITGSLRIGVSAQFVRNVLAIFGNKTVEELNEIWPHVAPPYTNLLQWLEGIGPAPETEHYSFKPFMLSHAIQEDELSKLDLDNFLIEWKWDGIRVQGIGGETPGLFTRTGDNIITTFPDLVPTLQKLDAIIDGELLVRYENGNFGNFNDLQQRLNRKKVTQNMLQAFPAWIRVYDLLFLQGDDLRQQPLSIRRNKLKKFLASLPANSALDLSPEIDSTSIEKLAALRLTSDQNKEPCEGLMLKAKSSLYIAGRKKGFWYKWKRDPYLIDAVLLYANLGTGKRSSYYSDYTFGVWHENQLSPVGKAYFGFTDEELKQLDKWIRQHVVAKFGPVRQVEPLLVFEIAFEDIRFSNRHKSGIALRFPRINRIRWDKPAEEADKLSSLVDLAKSKES